MSTERSAARVEHRRTARASHPRPEPARERDEQEALMRVAAAAAAAHELDDVLELACEAALDALGAASFSISRWERDRGVMRTLINVGDLAPDEERCPDDEIYFLDEHPSVGTLLRTAQPYFNAVDDPDADPRARQLLRDLGKESDVGVPVVVDGEVWGEAWASTGPGAPRFRGRDVRFVEAIAGQLAGVIARGEMFSRVSRLAFEDELTGLANRRALDERLEGSTRRWRSGASPLTLMVCDMDELKTINDERGHHAGDRALRRVAGALVKAAAPYPGSFVARISGDEFAVVLDGAPVQAASDVAATALRILREERDTRVTISCGAAMAGTGMEEPEALMRAADAAQYVAKRQGGGQLCTAGADKPHEALAAGLGRRRSRRRGGSERMEEASSMVLAMLDTTLAERDTLDRLEAVCASFAEVINAAGWTISLSPTDSNTIRSLCTAEGRDTRLRGIRLGLDHEVYALGEYPLTARMVAAGNGTFLVDRYDNDADPAERRLLIELDYSAVLAAAVSDADGTYLVELYADGDTRDLPGVTLPLSLLVRAAVATSASAREGVRSLRRRTRHLAVTGHLMARLATATTEPEVLEAAVEELHGEFGFPLCSIVRLTPAGEVELAEARGTMAERLQESGWRQPAGVGLIGRALREREVVVVGDVHSEPDYRQIGDTRGVRSELCAPVFVDDQLWGAIDLEDHRPDAFSSDEAHLMRTVADQMGSALRATGLYGKLEHAYLDTAQALVAAVETRGARSAAHTRAVTANALAVGRVLGLDDEGLRELRFAAAFHDVGKLAIPDGILDKREPLTRDDWDHIRRHTVAAEQILAPIEFLAPVRPLVRSCHERWDGTGYPDGLAGEQIPLGARIVFACHAYDAMISDRPHRPALTREEALGELRSCRGSQFDPRVVAALLTVLTGGAAPPLMPAAD
jgi:diguanylate cyclase (GGDEF)-like protein